MQYSNKSSLELLNSKKKLNHKVKFDQKTFLISLKLFQKFLKIQKTFSRFFCLLFSRDRDRGERHAVSMWLVCLQISRFKFKI